MLDEVYISGINQMNMVVGRLLTKGDFENAITTVKSTREFFLKGKEYDAFVIVEALELLVHHYGEIQSKISLSTEFGKIITEDLSFYIEERKRMLKLGD